MQRDDEDTGQSATVLFRSLHSKSKRDGIFGLIAPEPNLTSARGELFHP